MLLQNCLCCASGTGNARREHRTSARRACAPVLEPPSGPSRPVPDTPYKWATTLLVLHPMLSTYTFLLTSFCFILLFLQLSSHSAGCSLMPAVTFSSSYLYCFLQSLFFFNLIQCLVLKILIFLFVRVSKKILNRPSPQQSQSLYHHLLMNHIGLLIPI